MLGTSSLPSHSDPRETVTFAEKHELRLWLNGKPVVERNPDPNESLIHFVRRKGYTGTKLGCSEGCGCGSCTVVVESFDYATDQVVTNSVNSCLAPACSVDGKHVITIEGLGNAKNPHVVQTVIAEAHGSQCGFCTPGIAMSLYAAMKKNPHADEHVIEDAFDGNLCRCTGYRPILEGAKKVSPGGRKDSWGRGDLGAGEYIAKRKANYLFSFQEGDVDIEDMTEIPFPPTLLEHYLKNPEPVSYVIDSGEVKWFHPATVDELLDIMDAYPKAKIINGNTEVGIEVRFKNQKYPVLINTQDIPELRKTVAAGDGITFGAATTLTSLQEQILDLRMQLKPHQTRGLVAILDNIKYFAGHQVRNVSAIAGNICTASPISDLNPVWVALGAVVTVRSRTGGERKIAMEEFFLGYRQIALQPTEVVVSIFVPFTTESEYVKSFKQAKRREDDIAIVNSCIRVAVDMVDGKAVVCKAVFVFGGM
ncbi:hypothetical protein BDK51DRAFT_17584, partial [Blyttiomyces helicus]